MDASAFQLNERRLRELIDSHVVSVFGSPGKAQAEGWLPMVETFVVDYSGDPSLHDVPPVEELAYYVWLLATSGCIEMPEDFAKHGVLGWAVRGPERDEALVIQVQCPDGGRVISDPISADELLGDQPVESFDRAIEELLEAARRITAIASDLIPAARALAAAR